MNDDHKTTIRDIAAEAGVSISLVSFVMNNRVEADGKKRYRVNEETKQKILDVALRLNYQPNNAARSLRSGRTETIGVILSDISNVFYGEIARGMENIAYESGYTVLFGSTDENAGKLDRLVDTFINKGVDGFIIVPCEHAESSIHRVIRSGIPLVLLDRRPAEFKACKIVIDNVEAMGMAVNALLEKGLRRIEMISYSIAVTSMTEREEGYCRAMRSAGLEKYIRINHVDFNHIGEEVGVAIRKMLARRTEGVVFATNTLTLAGIKSILHQGARIQEQIHIVGFDDSDAFALFYPPISHVRQPIEEISVRSFKVLKELIDSREPATDREIILHAQLIEN